MGKRLDWIDCGKGITILLVVLGHVADGYLSAGTFPEQKPILLAIYNLIYAFHMPLFYCLSGFVFYLAYCVRREEKRKRFISQVLNLVWIYVFFSIALWVFKMIFSDSVNTQFGLRDLVNIPIKPLGEFWYIYVLIFIYVISYILENKQCDAVILGVSYVMSSIVKLFTFGIDFPLKSIFYYFFFFYLGVFMAKRVRKPVVIKHTKEVLLGFGMIAILSWSICIIWKTSVHKIPVFCTLVGMVFCILAMCLFQHSKQIKLFGFLGKYSLEIYTMHTFLTAANRSILIRGWGQKLLSECVAEFYNKCSCSCYCGGGFEKNQFA